MNSAAMNYKSALRCIFDSSPIIAQTTKNPDGQPVTSLTSNYLCLQCPATVTEDDRLKHWTKKSHRFCTPAPAGGRAGLACC
jgi:ubiquitin carboxyl-terminal hydrolase 22/27/51